MSELDEKNARRIVAAWKDMQERRVFLYMEACGGHGRNGHDAYLASGTRGLTYAGLPWYWDPAIRDGRTFLI